MTARRESIADLDAMLAGATAPAVVEVELAPPAAVVAARAAAAGWHPMVVDGRRVVDRGSAFAAVAAGCSFPDWFGHNLDAMADCLGDLSWQPPGPHVVVWTHAGRLDGLDARLRNGLRSVLAEAADRPLPHTVATALLR